MDEDQAGQWTEQDVARMLANPIYAISLDRSLLDVPHPLISRDEWVKANVRLI